MDHPPAPVLLYQIAYSPQTLAAVEPGWRVLDNLANPRPDWYEFWAVREYLQDTTLDEDAWYGFFSPKFGRKTGLDHGRVTAFVHAAAAQADVVLFSPQADMGAFFLNVFEQGETFDPGFLDAATAFLQAAGRPAGLREMMMDSRHIVFSNYFVARPAFWREWLALNEQLFAICEGPDSPLRQRLVQATTYPGAAQRKVFLMERMASYLLATQARWRSVAANPFNFAWSTSRLSQFPLDAFVSDALKIAMREQGYPEYMRAFSDVRQRFMRARAA
ncbi:MAG TPA: hypothetical protein VEZ89_12105 [Rubrivivax sp.]|nr:hypothetical protein [Rubrivivax sp.]